LVATAKAEATHTVKNTDSRQIELQDNYAMIFRLLGL
jgi:hypothetical protein